MNGTSRPVLGRRLIYLTAAVAGFFVFVSIVLAVLEKHQLIDTQRPDDLVAKPPIDLLETRSDRIYFGDINTPNGSLPAQKSPKTLRIVCVGGSFMMGFPYTQAGAPSPGWVSIPFWMQKELAFRLPQSEVEVINLAGVAQNSNRVAAIVEKIGPLQPDLVIVAAGNNEGNLAPTRFNDGLHEWVLYRAMKKVLTRPSERAQRPIFSPQDPDVEGIEKQYQKNIERMIGVCESRNTPLILATLPINLRYKDYIADTHSGGAREPEGDPAIEAGKRLMEQCRYGEAIDAFSKSAHLACAMNYMGRCYQTLGDYKRARELFKGAVQLNPLTRTRPSFNEFIRGLPLQPGFFRVDLERKVEQASVGGIAPDEFFLDYCHLPWWGNYMMAFHLCDGLIDQVLAAERKKALRPAPNLDELMSPGELKSLTDLPESLAYINYIRPWISGEGTFPAEPKLPDCIP